MFIIHTFGKPSWGASFMIFKFDFLNKSSNNSLDLFELLINPTLQKTIPCNTEIFFIDDKSFFTDILFDHNYSLWINFFCSKQFSILFLSKIFDTFQEILCSHHQLIVLKPTEPKYNHICAETQNLAIQKHNILSLRGIRSGAALLLQ